MTAVRLHAELWHTMASSDCLQRLPVGNARIIMDVQESHIGEDAPLQAATSGGHTTFIYKQAQDVHQQGSSEADHPVPDHASHAPAVTTEADSPQLSSEDNKTGVADVEADCLEVDM